MKIRIEDVNPDGMYVYIDSPICVMTWDELFAFLKLFDKISRNPENFTLVSKSAQKENNVQVEESK